jgi:glycosyltransferase involved in cell wall biosynthesis
MMRAPFAPAGPARVPRLGEPRPCEVVRRAATAAAPRLAVVVPSYDTASYLGAAVRSLLAQTMPDLEVIVVDDGSHDDSVQRVLAIPDRRLTVVRQHNRGLAGARNTGILLARAPFIGFCDSDDLWHPRKAERHLERMERTPDVGVTFSFSAYLDHDGVPTGQLLATACAEPTVRDLVRRNHLGNGSTAVVRRTCFERVGLYDESIANAEEWELWVRIAALAALRIVRIPEPLTGYRIRAGSLSASYDSFLRNAWIAIQRFGEHVPGFSARAAQRAYAEVLRIASRKSIAAGEVNASQRFLLEAARRSPSLFLRDPRAFAMAAIHLTALPLRGDAQRLPYRALERVMRPLYRAVIGATAGEEWRRAGASP